mgnify:CR=1 FL=1
MSIIQSVQAIPIRIPRDTPYLGKLEDGVTVTDTGYFVRPGNRSVYSMYDQSLLVKITTADGISKLNEKFESFATSMTSNQALQASSLIGQDTMVRTLTNAFDSGRIAHAFILTGVRGVGKTTTARIIAKALNCVGPGGDGDATIEPCGKCQFCTSIAEDERYVYRRR